MSLALCWNDSRVALVGEPSRRPQPVGTALFAPLHMQIPNIRQNAQCSWAEPEYNGRGQEILSGRIFTPPAQEVRRPSAIVTHR